MSLLQIEGLSVSFDTPLGAVQAAQDVSLELEDDETLALVGETVCGKSVVVNAILQLLPANARVQGRIIYKGRNLLQLNEREMSWIRGREISIVFQNPSLALNPVYNVADQVAEPLLLQKASKKSALEASRKLLARLGLEGFEEMYPFQLSGGMNQRAMIACSVVLRPRIIIADEPTKGLDQELVKGVLEEIQSTKEESGASLLLITHDLDVARSVADRISVMYSGEIAEVARPKALFREPLHPYTRALLDSSPERGLLPISGTSPSMIHSPEGCKFHPRCPLRQEICSRQRPNLSLSKERQGRCWLWA